MKSLAKQVSATAPKDNDGDSTTTGGTIAQIEEEKGESADMEKVEKGVEGLDLK